MPRISVIVPVYKVEPYLHRCIDSILAQTFTDFELILVDDGSPDNCGAICDEYAEKDERIHVIHQENGGLSSARNAGLDIAQGEYILFCDSDDYVAPEWCQVLLCEIRKNPNLYICCDVHRITTNNAYYMQKTPSVEYKAYQLSYFEIYKRGLSPYAVNKIYSLNLINKENLRFDENCKYAEDVEFNVKYCMQCSSQIFIPDKLYYYVQNNESIMHKYYANVFELHLPLFYCRLPLIESKNLPEYCDIWLYQFLELFKNVFDPRCPLSLIQKLRYNQKMINTKEFRFCLENASGKNENPLVIKMLKTHNYYLYWLFEKLVQLKQKIGGNSK